MIKKHVLTFQTDTPSNNIEVRCEFRILQLLRVSGQDVVPGSLPLFLLFPALVPSRPTRGFPHTQALSASLLQTAALSPLIKPRDVGSGCTLRRVGRGGTHSRRLEVGLGLFGQGILRCQVPTVWARWAHPLGLVDSSLRQEGCGWERPDGAL